MWKSLCLEELIIVFLTIIASLLLRHYKRNNELTQAAKILGLLWVSHLVLSNGTPAFRFAAKRISESKSGLSYYDEALAVYMIVAVTMYWLIILITKQRILKLPIRGFFLTSNFHRQILNAWLISLVTFFTLYGANIIVHSPDYRYGGFLDYHIVDLFPRIAIICLAVLISPVAEELIFRGFLFTSAEKPLGTVGAVLFTTIAWTAFHPNRQLFGYFATGLITAVIYARTRSLIGPVMFHLSINLFQIMRWVGIV